MSYLGENVKKLGFGLMRLPQKDGAIDIEQTKVMVDKFMAAGFTYFDTAWVYAGSEDAIRQALVKRYPRESYTLATKLCPWMNCENQEQAEAEFETSLKQTGAGYFDFYLLHNLGDSRTHLFDDYDLWNFVQRKKAEGLIKHIGFSSHATPEELETILQKHPEMEFVQLQINYADWDNPAIQSRRCYEIARKYGKPVVIMEPVKGGMLATPPDTIQNIFRQVEPDSSMSSWAIRFAADLEGVITVLSGMSSTEQMEDNLSYMKDFSGLNAAQKEALKKAQEELQRVPSIIPCTVCNYCAEACPMNIGISGAFTAMNYLTLYSDIERATFQYLSLVQFAGKKGAGECIKCGKCEAVCPQRLGIRDLLVDVAGAFEPKNLSEIDAANE